MNHKKCGKKGVILGIVTVIIVLAVIIVFVSKVKQNITKDIAEMKRSNVTDVVEYDVLANVDVKLKR